MMAYAFGRLRIMLWELWRASRWELLMRIVSLVSFILLIYGLSRHMEPFQFAIVRGLAVIVIGMVTVFSSSWTGDLDNQSKGFTFRLGFTRPISTAQLVVVPWTYSVASSVLIYNLSALIFFGLLGQALPIMLPSLLIACVVALFISVVWASETGLEKILGLFLATLFVIILFWQRNPMRNSDFPALIAIGDANSLEVRWFDWLSSAAICAACLAITITAVGRQRRGEHWGWSRWIRIAVAWFNNANWMDAGQQAVSRRLSPPQVYGSVRMQWWFEIRRSIYLAVVAVGLSSAALAFIVLVPLVNADWSGPMSPRLWLIAMACVPFICLISSVDKLTGLQVRQGWVTLSKFDATRPLRCDQLVAIKLLTCAVWTVCALMLVVILAALHTWMAGNWPHWNALYYESSLTFQKILHQSPRLLSGESAASFALNPAWTVVVSFAISLTLACAATPAALMTFSFWLSRYKGVFLVLAVILMLHCGLFALDRTLLKGSLQPLWSTYTYVIPIGIALGCSTLIVRAGTSHLVGRWYVGGVAALWLLFVASSLHTLYWLATSWQISAVPVFLWMVIIGELLIPAAAALAAPLAFAAYRHQ